MKGRVNEDLTSKGKLPSLAYILFSFGFTLSPAQGRRTRRQVLIGSYRIHSCMTLIKKHRVRTKTSLTDTLPEMLVSALANHEDFVVTCETDPETKKKSLYVMTGNLITPEILALIRQQIEHKKEEGSTIITRDWK